MLHHGIPANGVHVVQRGGKAYLAAHVAGARLKLAGALRPGGAVLVHGADHVAAAQKGRHLVQQLGPGVQGTHAHGGIQLVGGAGRKVHVQLLHVHRHMGCALGAVQHHHGPYGVCPGHDGFHRGPQAQHVGHHAHGNQLGLGGDLLVQLLLGQIA